MNEERRALREEGHFKWPSARFGELELDLHAGAAELFQTTNP